MDRNRISEKKLEIVRRNVSNIRTFIEKLSELRSEQYEVKNEEWLYKIDNINSILESKSYFLFIGGYSSGKSSFINALLGKNILPTASQPCTNVVTEVSFVDSASYDGSSRSDEIFYKSNPTNGQIKTREDLLDIIGGKTSIDIGSVHHISIKFDIQEFGDKASLYQAYVNKVVFVDCPGFDSPYQFSEEVLTEYIEKSSYTFYFLPADRFGGQTEILRLHTMKKRTATLIPIISKSDIISSDEQKEDIVTQFMKTLGRAFASQSPIFVSTYKFYELVQFCQKVQNKILQGQLSQKESDRINELNIACGIHRFNERLSSKSQESSLNEKKLESALVDFNNLVGELLRSYYNEQNFWKNKLTKLKFDMESESYSDLMEYEKRMTDYITSQSDEASKAIKNRIVSEIYTALLQNGQGNIDLESGINRAIDEIYNDYKPKWEEHIRSSYKVSGKTIDELKLPQEIVASLQIPKSLSYIPTGLLNGIGRLDNVSIFSGLGGATLIGLHPTIASLTIPVFGIFSFSVGTYLAPIALMGGLALVGTSVAKNISPLRDGIKDEKRQKQDEMRSQISKVLANVQAFDFTQRIKKNLTEYKDSILNATRFTRNPDKDKYLQNYNICVEYNSDLNNIQTNMNQQLS